MTATDFFEHRSGLSRNLKLQCFRLARVSTSSSETETMLVTFEAVSLEALAAL